MAAQSLPTIRIENTGAAQTNVPFTFGQVFKPGDVKPGQGLEGRLSNGDVVSLQMDEKAVHADGSVRHAIISGILPTLFAKEERGLALAPAVSTKAPTATRRVGTARVVLMWNGQEYTADFAPTKDPKWIDGPIVSEWPSLKALVDDKGAAHPYLQVRFAQRCYAGERTRLEAVVENTKTWLAGRSFTYDVLVQLNSKTVFEQKGLTHYRHARWRKVFWLGQEPEIHVKHDIEYLIATKAVSNYNTRTNIASAYLDEVAKSASAANTAPMKLGPIVDYMPMAGGRGDIGSLPSNAVQYLVTADKRARAPMIAAADGSGSWSVHYRDEKTGYPVRTDSDANKNLTTHPNMAAQGPLPVPRYVNPELAHTPYEADTAHQPSLAYLPYLLTGEYYYLEELQFWAAWNPLGTAPGNHGNGQGLVRWQQLRGQAWSLRTLGHAAYITPDSHPMKAYFTKQLDNNLDFYHATYVVGSPNKLGVYDGSGANAFEVTASAPWQDDFLTWSFGYLSELGFTKATPILQWKAKYSVGRMTAPGYCWMEGAAYGLNFRPAPGMPIYETFEQLYKANFGGDAYKNDDGKMFVHPQGLKYIDQPCGSQVQADFLTLANGYRWDLGRMTGYSDSPLGYPQNMQPALAVSADVGIPNSEKAWRLHEARTWKPDTKAAPQWDIIPRTLVAVEVAPAPVTPVEDPEWEKIGLEGYVVKITAKSEVRYGVPGGEYVTKIVDSDFTASNAFFGKDPAPGKGKVVEIRRRAAIVVPTPTKNMTIVTPPNKALSKMKKLTVQVEDLNAMKIEQNFTAIEAAIDGSVSVAGPDFTKSKKYQVTIRNENNMLVGVFYPMSAI